MTNHLVSIAMWKRHSRKILAVFGCILLGAGSLVAYWWLYKLAPVRHLTDREWLSAHSEKARWIEEQKDYERMGSSPDLCFRGDRIGYYGGKEWFLWLDERIRNPDKFRYCGCTEYALALMANRHVSSWKQWTDTNRGRSQEEWIKDGFIEYGVAVQLPPRADDAIPLLRLLARRSWNFLWAGPQGTNAPDAVPSYIHYNAYRWLRDSGFNPVGFASSNTTLATQSDISEGLLKFSQWRTAYPGDDGLGVLSFDGGEHPSKGEMPRPGIIARPSTEIAVHAFIGISILGGLILVFRTAKASSQERVDQTR